MQTQQQPKIIDLRREFDQNQCWKNIQPLGREIIKLRHDFDASMDQRDYAEAVNTALPLAIATNEVSDRNRLEKALDALSLIDFHLFTEIIEDNEGLWAIARDFCSDEPLEVLVKILNKITGFGEYTKALKYEKIEKNDLIGLLDVFKNEIYSHPILPLWDQEKDARLLIRENRNLVYRGNSAPIGMGWWVAFSRMFHLLPVNTTIACPTPLTELFKLNFPFLIFAQDFDDREFSHECDPICLPSIFNCLPKEAYLSYPDLNPKKGKIGYGLGDRKRINRKDVIENLPEDFDEITDLEDEDLVKQGFLATAREIASCSFVIGADAPSIHLAGAMGVPSAIVLTKHHDGRFGLNPNGDRVSWYDRQRIIKAFN